MARPMALSRTSSHDQPDFEASVESSTQQRASNSFADGYLLEYPVAELAFEVQMNFPVFYSIGGHSKDRVALFQVHENLH
jgi:hypothetical protein